MQHGADAAQFLLVLEHRIPLDTRLVEDQIQDGAGLGRRSECDAEVISLGLAASCVPGARLARRKAGEPPVLPHLPRPPTSHWLVGPTAMLSGTDWDARRPWSRREAPAWPKGAFAIHRATSSANR